MSLKLKELKPTSLMRVMVECPYCQGSLMNKRVLLGNKSSIKLIGKLTEDEKGVGEELYLSSYYGDYKIKTGFEIPEGAVVEFYCSKCLKSLCENTPCNLCQAPLVNVQLEGKGMMKYCLDAYKRRLPQELRENPIDGRLQFCSRRGCGNHFVNFANSEVNLKDFYDKYASFIE